MTAIAFQRPMGLVRRGFTLPELLVALPMMALLMAGLGTAIKTAGKAVPDGTSVASAALTSSRSLEMFAADVSFATSITTNVTTSAASRQLTFSIPDRDGLAPAVETVTYSWSGVAGDPLQRTFNGTTSTVATNVQEFTLNYDKRTKSVVTTSTTTAPEALLISSDGTSSVGDSSITTSNWCGQFFQPALASNVIGWNVTKVKFRARLNGSTDGSTNVQIRTANNQLPTNTVLDQVTMSESSLSSSYALKTFTFSSVPMQSPTTGLCLVLQLAANSPSGYAQYWAGGNSVNSCFVSTANTGGTWTTSTDNSLRYYVYGTVQAQTANTTYQYLLTNVRCTLRTGGSASSQLQTSIRVLNEPQVNGP